MTPKISVIVIGYNIEQYISQCLESVLAQDYSNFELIFVDDGSQDNTLSIAQKFSGDSRVKIIHKENGGCVSARKAGLRVADGEYISFVDGDDWLNPDMLSNLVKELNSHDERIDIVVSNFFWQNEAGTFREAKNYKGISICHEYEYLDLIMKGIIFHSLIPKLYRREFVINAGYLDYPEVTMAEDLMSNYFFGLHKPVVCFSKTCNYYYRYNTQSVIRQCGNKLIELVKTLRLVEEYFKSQEVEAKYNELMQSVWLGQMMCYVLYVKNIPIQNKIKFSQECKPKIKGFRNNKYCLELWNRTRRINKLLFTGYERCPHMMYVLQPAIILLRKCVTALRLAKKLITRK